MDILYYIGLMILQGLFFYWYSETKSTVNLQFVIIMSLLSILFLMNFGVNYTDWGQYSEISSGAGGSNKTVDYVTYNIDNSTIGNMSVLGFIVLVNLWNIFLSLLFWVGYREQNGK